MYEQLFANDDFITNVVGCCRRFRKYVNERILDSVGGHSSSIESDGKQYIGTKKVLIEGDVLQFIDKVYWLSYHIERFLTWNTPKEARYADLRSAIANIPGGRFTSEECNKLVDVAVSFFKGYEEIVNSDEIIGFQNVVKVYLSALDEALVGQNADVTVADKLESLDIITNGGHGEYFGSKDYISSYCKFLFNYLYDMYNNFDSLLTFSVGNIDYSPISIYDIKEAGGNFLCIDDDNKETTVNIKTIDVISPQKVLMELEDVHFNSFEEIVSGIENIGKDTVGGETIDLDKITDIIYDYRVQVMCKFPNAVFDESLDEFGKIMLTIQRLFNNLYNPAVVDIIENGRWH